MTRLLNLTREQNAWENLKAISFAAAVFVVITVVLGFLS